LDLSLRSPGAVVVGTDWGLEWRRVMAFEAPPDLSLPADASDEDRVARMRSICRWARTMPCDIVAMERIAYAKNTSAASEMAGLWWAVRAAMSNNGTPVRTIAVNQARALLGKAPKAQPKVWAHRILYDAGAPRSWGGDTCDAFLVANVLLAEEGVALIAR